jgi:hypothetical protein
MMGVVAGLYHKAHTKIIRLQFLVPAIFHTGVLTHHIGHLGRAWSPPVPMITL